MSGRSFLKYHSYAACQKNHFCGLYPVITPNLFQRLVRKTTGGGVGGEEGNIPVCLGGFVFSPPQVPTWLEFSSSSGSPVADRLQKKSAAAAAAWATEGKAPQAACFRSRH